MAAQVSFQGTLSDAEMRKHLEAGMILSFKGPGGWQELEHQVERLGFGDVYAVTQTIGRRGNVIKITPLRQVLREQKLAEKKGRPE